MRFLNTVRITAAMLLLGISTYGLAITRNVTTATQLQAALNAANPGDVINVDANSIYYLGQFTVTRSGTAQKPITLKGVNITYTDALTVFPSLQVNSFPRSTGGDNPHRWFTVPKSDPSLPAQVALHFLNASYWRVQYLAVQNAQKGIVLDNSHHIDLTDLVVRYIGQEAVHFRTNSHDNTIEHSQIEWTGMSSDGSNRNPNDPSGLPPDDRGLAEGVYIGSAVPNWATYTNGLPDKSDNNCIYGNTIGPGIGSEGIDIKEATTGTLVLNNQFYSWGPSYSPPASPDPNVQFFGLSGLNSADSLIDVKGYQAVLYANSLDNVTGIGGTSSLYAGSPFLLDGIQTHNIKYPVDWPVVALRGTVIPNSGDGNIFKVNDVALGTATGYRIKIQTAGTNIVCANNETVITTPRLVISNVPLSNVASCNPVPAPQCPARF
ncbi:MAG: coagulation factor 5/8 type protein [Rhodocyclales bacterium]|nr:coagulation factor 5/8 type protein [Rhodocyclales bacterium]